VKKEWVINKKMPKKGQLTTKVTRISQSTQKELVSYQIFVSFVKLKVENNPEKNVTFTAFNCLYIVMEQTQFKKEILPSRERLVLYAERLLENKSDAEDIIQEVFLKLWLMRDELDGYDSVEALSVTMTKHLCLNRLKINQREREDVTGVVIIDENLSPDEQLEQKDSVAHVMRIIDRLPGLQQAVLRMKHIEGLEIDEIAALTGSAPEAVRMNLSRARKKVKELFFKDNK